MRSSDQKIEWLERQAAPAAEALILESDPVRLDVSGQMTNFASLTPEGHGNWFYFAQLIYSVFLFIEPFERKSSRYWLEFAGAYCCFLVLYFFVIRSRTKPTAYTLLFLMGILGAGYFPRNGGALAIFIYIALFAPFLTESLRVCVYVILSVCLAMTAEGILLHLSSWSWAFGSFFALAIGSGNFFVAQQQRNDRKLRMAHAEIERLAKMAERERIARDLHDVLGHTLSVIVLKSELAGKLISQNLEQSCKEIAEVEQIARAALVDVREAIRGYRSEGLAAEIARARNALDAAGVVLDCGAPPAPMPAPEETVLSLVLRETVTNIVRHSEAKKCRVEFQKDGSDTLLIVEDDGRGQIRKEGNGLRGMRERVHSVGGSVNIQSDSGTRLEVRIPARA